MVVLIIVTLLALACSDPLSPPPRRQPRHRRKPGQRFAALRSANGTAPANQAQKLEDNGIWFEQISLEQGLSQSVVLSILQDSRGFMWFATQDGLNRYDGHEFVVYKHDSENPNSLSDNFVNALYEDPSGALWIGTNGGGLDRLDPGTGQFTHHDRTLTIPRA